MTSLVHLSPGDPAYPIRLTLLPTPPAHLSIEGHLAPAKVVAIVGTRNPLPETATFAHALAGAVARGGGVVASGGATGIDAAAHEGALAAGGRTWVVAGTGHGVLYPKQHGPLYERVVAGGGAMIWPFAPGSVGHPSRFLVRNGVLVALADAFVLVQARIPSGALNAASWAKRLGRPRWVVCPPPWMADDAAFAGCQVERRAGAEALTSVELFLDAIGLPAKPVHRAPPAPLPARQNPMETRVLAAVGSGLCHAEEVAVRCGLPYPAVMTLLLTLVLDDVLVEGPEGFFRQASTP